MYKSNSAEVYSFYNSFDSIAELFKSIQSDKLEILQAYLKVISRYRVEKLIKGSQGGYLYRGAIFNLEDDCLNYCIESITGREEQVTEKELKERVKINTAVMISIAESTLLEIKYAIYIMASGNTNEYANENYPILGYALDLRSRSVKREVEVCMSLLFQLNGANIAIPKFLVDYYNSDLMPWYRKKCVAEKLVKLGISEEVAIDIMSSKLKLVEIANEIIQESGDAELQDRIARLILLFYNTYNRVTGNGKRDINYLANISMKEVFHTHAKMGDRLATKTEVKLKVAGIFKKEKYFLDSDKRDKLLWLVYYSTGDRKYLKSLGKIRSMYAEFDDKENITSLSGYNILEEAFRYLSSPEFMKHDSADLLEGRNEIEYLDTAEDEIKDMGLVEKLQAVVEYCSKSKNEYDKLAYQIAKGSLEKRNAALSVKQLKVINIAYEKHSKVSNSDIALYKEAEQIIKSLTNLHKYRSIDFMYKFISDIKKYKKCSPKQLEVLKSELLVYSNTDEYEIDGQDTDIDLDKYMGNEKTAELDRLIAKERGESSDEIDDQDDEEYDLDSIGDSEMEEESDLFDEDFDDSSIDLDELEDSLKEKYRSSKTKNVADIGLEESSMYEEVVKNRRNRRAPLLKEIDTSKLIF